MFQIETIEHIFYDCIEVKNFWLALMDKYNECFSLSIKITCKDIILIYKGENELFTQLLNLLMLYGKKYLYKCKLKNSCVNLMNFLKYLQSVLLTIDFVKKTEEEKYAYLEQFVRFCL